jgi:hypothetical protein
MGVMVRMASQNGDHCKSQFIKKKIGCGSVGEHAWKTTFSTYTDHPRSIYGDAINKIRSSNDLAKRMRKISIKILNRAIPIARRIPPSLTYLLLSPALGSKA